MRLSPRRQDVPFLSVQDGDAVATERGREHRSLRLSFLVRKVTGHEHGAHQDRLLRVAERCLWNGQTALLTQRVEGVVFELVEPRS